MTLLRLIKLLSKLKCLQLRLEPAHMVPGAYVKDVPAQEMKRCIPTIKVLLTIPASVDLCTPSDLLSTRVLFDEC